jgi:hypothetical protein
VLVRAVRAVRTVSRTAIQKFNLQQGGAVQCL